MNYQICFITIASIVFGSLTVFGQSGPTLETYRWEPTRGQMAVADSLKKYPAVILKNYVAHEYYYDEVDQSLRQYSINHKIIRVNTDVGINSFNRIYIPVDSPEELADLQARSISPGGEIFIIDQDDIREIKDEQENEGFRIFAVEGLEKGSEVEYFYKQKKAADYFGREFFQSKVPTLNASLELICPANLQFSLKSYNGFPDVEESYDENSRLYQADRIFIAPLKEEKYSYFNSNRQRVEFKLSYNAATGSQRLLTWSDAAARIHESIFTLDENELRKAREFFEQFKFKKRTSSLEKAKAIENLIKSDFLVRNIGSSEFSSLLSTIDNKVGNHTGIMKLYVTMFKLARVEHQVVVTTKRDNVKFDPKFDSWNYLVNYLIYLDELDLYLAPLDAEYRLGMVPFLYTHNYGLFVEELQMGDNLTASGETAFIPALPYDHSEDRLDIKVSFDEAKSVVNLNTVRTISGYNAVYIQPYYPFLDEESKKEVIENYVR
jgi:hypothetical protein